MTTLGHSLQLQAPSTASAIKLLSGKDTKTRKGYRIVYGTHLFMHADNTDVCDRYHTMFSKRHATRLQREAVEFDEHLRHKRRHQALGV